MTQPRSEAAPRDGDGLQELQDDDESTVPRGPDSGRWMRMPAWFPYAYRAARREAQSRPEAGHDGAS